MSTRIKEILRTFEKLKRARSFPKLVHAEFHLTDRCNLRCYFCNQAAFRKMRFSEIAYKLIIDTLAQMRRLGLCEVRLSGGGEPTCHPAFQKIIAYLYEHDITLDDLTTNGLLCDKPMVDLLCSGSWVKASFSLNSLDAKDWVAMTGGLQKSFYKILDNIRYLVERKRSSKSPLPKVVLSIGIDERTYKKLVKNFVSARDLGIDLLVFQTYNYIRYPRKVLSAKASILDQMREIDADLAATKSGMLVGYAFGDLNLNEAMQQDEALSHSQNGPVCLADYDEPCFMPWYGTMIRANGDVDACCAAYAYTSLGNIHDVPFKTIWRGEKYKALRVLFEKAFRSKAKDLQDLKVHIACTPFAPPDHGCPVKVDLGHLLKGRALHRP